jgi:hypothetical protein
LHHSPDELLNPSQRPIDSAGTIIKIATAAASNSWNEQMKITTNGMLDEISITGLKDEEYTILVGALREAAKDIATKSPEYIAFYGADRGAVVQFFNRFWEEDGKLSKGQ